MNTHPATALFVMEVDQANATPEAGTLGGLAFQSPYGRSAYQATAEISIVPQPINGCWSSTAGRAIHYSPGDY